MGAKRTSRELSRQQPQLGKIKLNEHFKENLICFANKWCHVPLCNPMSDVISKPNNKAILITSKGEY